MDDEESLESKLAAALKRIIQLEDQLCECEDELDAAASYVEKQDFEIDALKTLLEIEKHDCRKLKERLAEVEAKTSGTATSSPTVGTTPTKPPPSPTPTYPPGYTPNPVVEAMIGAYQPTNRDAKENANVTPSTRSPVYGDCPACGKASNLSAVDPEAIAGCPSCERENYAKCWLNLRTTPQRVDPRGFIGRMFLGSGLQKSLQEQRAESRASLEANIRSCRGLITTSQMSGDFQKAMFYQRRLEQLEQQLEDFDNEDDDDDFEDE